MRIEEGGWVRSEKGSWGRSEVGVWGGLSNVYGLKATFGMKIKVKTNELFGGWVRIEEGGWVRSEGKPNLQVVCAVHKSRYLIGL